MLVHLSIMLWPSPLSFSSSFSLAGVSTYLDSKHECHCYGSKVGSGKRQSRRGEKVIDVIHRSHNGSKRCQEECRSNRPSKWGVSAAQTTRTRGIGSGRYRRMQVIHANTVYRELRPCIYRVHACANRCGRCQGWIVGEQRGRRSSKRWASNNRQGEVTTSSKTYRITNLRGLRERTGKRVKQMTKQAAAARLQKANTSMRSHRLTTPC
jgi:hypothetical protein